MTTLILIFFGFLFYQLLIKTAFQTSLSPNKDQKSKLTDQFQQMHRQQQTTHSQHRNNTTTKRNYHSSEREGYKGGEYIDFEEL